MNQSKRASGFTLLEVSMALSVMGVAMLGALAGMIAASKNITEGQMLQYSAALAESYAQGFMLKDRDLIAKSAVDFTSSPDTLPIGAAPWTMDPKGLFTVHEDGVVSAVTGAAANSCADASLPSGAFCRETAVVNGVPYTGAGTIPGTGYTLWIRVGRVGDPINKAVVHREVIVR